MTDKELMREVHRGNRAAFNEIAERYYDDIYRFCLFLTNNKEESCDIAQEVFLRFVKYAKGCSDRNLKGYLIMIARNLCCNFYKEVKNRPDVCAEEVWQNLPGCPDHAEEVEKQLVLAQALQGLSPKQREVIVMRFYQELKFGEIAEILGCNVSTVKTRCRQGVERLRAMLGDE